MSAARSSLLRNLMLGIVGRADGFMSAITGINSGTRDKNQSYTSYSDDPFDTNLLASLYNGGDIGSKIAKALPEKALKQGFGVAMSDDDVEPEIQQEKAKEILLEADRIGLRDKILEADIWGRVYGLGGIVLGASGSGAPEDPMDDELVTRLDWIMVVDRREVVPMSYYTDPASEKFGEVEYYRVTPTTAQGIPTGKRGMPAQWGGDQNSAGKDGQQIALLGLRIHETRFVRFPGVLTSRRDRQTNSGCDFSVYQRIYKTLQQTENNWDAVCELMSDMSQGVFKIDGLMKMIAAGNEAALQTRMQTLDMGRSVARAIVLDAEREDFSRVPTPMGGVDEIIMRTWQRLAAAAEMPLTVLFGVSPAGLNATGESDVRLWYDNVREHQEHVLKPRIQRIIRLISKTLGHEVDWTVTWPSLWQMTAPEQADYRLKTVQADDIEIKNGTTLPEEVALTRYASQDDFNGGKVQIDADARKDAMKASLEEMVNPTPPVVMAPAPKQLPGQPKQLPVPVEAKRADEVHVHVNVAPGQPVPEVVKTVEQEPVTKSDADEFKTMAEGLETMRRAGAVVDKDELLRKFPGLPVKTIIEDE